MRGKIEPRGDSWRVRFGRHVDRTFKNHDKAEQLLNKVRYEYGEGTFDSREFKGSKPLGLKRLTKEFITFKKDIHKRRSWKKMEWHLSYALAFFGNPNVRDITEGNLEYFYLTLPEHLSGKSKANIMSTLHSLFLWANKHKFKRGQWFIPDFPSTPFVLGRRKILKPDEKWSVVEEVKRISWHINPRIYIGILWLATYSNIRPIEITYVKEGDFHLNEDPPYFDLTYRKTDEPTRIYLIDEDVGLKRSLPTGMPHMWFFRHGKRKGATEGQKFAGDYLGEWWNRACDNLGIEGVSLYPGTKHTTLTDIAEREGYHAARQASELRTNKAMDRYLITDPYKQREIYQRVRRGGK